MKVLFISAGFLPAESHGGVPFSTFYLASALITKGCDVRVVTTDRNGAGRLKTALDQWVTYSGVEVWYASTFSGPYVFSRTIHKPIRWGVQWADIVICSSTLWDYSGFITHLLCKIYKKPHIQYPRGLLDKWAMDHKWLKKRIAWYMQGKKILKAASAIVALTEEERGSIASLGIRCPVYVIPNGCPEVNGNDHENSGPVDSKLASFIEKNSKNYVLFLGRVDRKKGLDQTIQAMAEVITKLPTALLVIAGPVSAAYNAELLKELVRIPQEQVAILGPVKGEEKELLLRNARALILTSHSEGLPIAVLEAMFRRVPVIVTPQCNVSGIEEFDAGWIVARGDIAATAKAIRELFENLPDSLHKGQNAACLVERQYRWDAVAKDTIVMIQNIINRKPCL